MPEVMDSRRPRAGRRFAPTHELALDADAVAACRTLPGAHRGVLVVRELTGPIGIPDLTALVGGERALEARLGLEIPPLLNEIDAAVAAVCHPSRMLSASAIAAGLSWPVETITRRMPGLLRAGAVVRVRDDRYVRPAALVAGGRLYVVEAKVNDRVGAVNQARMYSTWADGYVIVMGRIAPRPQAQLLAAVEADGGGLVLDGKWVRRPVIHRLPTARRLWAFEHLVAAISGAPHQPSVAP